MNKNRNKVAAMMMVAAITVSSVAMPVEAAVSCVESVGIERGNAVDQEIKDVKLDANNFPDDEFRKRLAEKFNIANDGTGVITADSIRKTKSITFSGGNKKIYSLEGIQNFVLLEDISISSQFIENVDLSRNINLKRIYFPYNNTRNIILPDNSLESVSVNGNNIENLDLKNNTSIKWINCSYNKIKEIKLEKYALLQGLGIAGNKLTNINLSNNTALKNLEIEDNNLQELNLINNTGLKILHFGNIELSFIDLSNQSDLEELKVVKSSIPELNLSKKIELSKLILEDNKELENINLKECNKLGEIELKRNNLIKSIDLSNKKTLNKVKIISNEKLEEINLDGSSSIRQLDIKFNRVKKLNLNEQDVLSSFYFYEENCGYLELNENAPVKIINGLEEQYINNVLVDSKTNSVDLSAILPGINMERVDVKTEGVNKDKNKLNLGNKRPRKIEYEYDILGNNTKKMTVFLNLSYNLPNEGVVLNDINFKDGNFRKRISDITGVQEGEVISSEQIARIRELNLSNSGIENLDGIEFFTALEMLDCYDNNITELDLRNNINLTEVDFGDNFISEFKLPSNIKIIHCKDNLFTELNLSQYSQLTTLDCSKNKDLVLIDVSQNTALKNLYASETKIKENNGINLVNNTELRKLVLDKNNLTNISLGTNTALETLSLSENELTEINLNANTALLSLYLDKNKLSNIDLSANTALTEIYLSNNKLKNLDLSTNKDLNKIHSSGTEGKILVNDNFDFEYDDVENYFHTEISFDLKNKDYIDLNEEYGITKDEIDNNRVILDSEEVKLNNLYFDGTKLKWNGKTPDFISYQYKCGGRKDKINLGVFLHLENGNPDKPNPNPNPGGGSGGGTTTPDQKPDQKPDEKPNKPNKPGNITSKIVGKNRYETAAKIADELVKNNVSYNSVILVNSDKSMADGLSAASLSGKKNAPILLVKKDSIPAEAMAKIEKAKNVYIIGGEGAISKNVENQLKGKNITRISGKDRYETSAKIANMLGGYKMAFIVNGAKGEADAMSVSSVAAKYGAPILLTNGKTSTHPVKEGVSYFVIGGRGVVSNQLADKYNADRIAGIDRYSTNRKVIDEFYYDSKKVYFTKGDTLVDALTASLLAKDNGMVLVSKNANHKKLEGKEAVQVGGMDFEISFE